jgi:hypothetical protein
LFIESTENWARAGEPSPIGITLKKGHKSQGKSGIIIRAERKVMEDQRPRGIHWSEFPRKGQGGPTTYAEVQQKVELKASGDPDL